MRFLVPAALGAAALALPLVVLYMLRSKRRPETVGSTMLWRRVGEPVSAAVPWKPLRMSWLLLLQLLILLLFVVSLARPFLAEATVLGPHTVFVVDTSGSMAMAGRFDQAQRSALDLAADISDANLGSVVQAGPTPRVLVAFSADSAAVRQAIMSLEAGGGVEDLSAAVRLARGLAAPDRDTNVVVFSDGGQVPIPEEPLTGVRHLVFDDLGPNLAISGFDAEPSAEGVTRVFVQVENHGPDRRTVDVALEVDGLASGTLQLEVEGLGAAREVIPVTAAPGSVVTARLVETGDALALDDRADLVVGGGPTRSVAVSGTGSPFLTSLLESIPGVRITDLDEADLVIVDGGELPEIDKPTWAIRTQSPPAGLELAGLERNLAVTFSRPGDPVLDGVDLSGVAVAEAQSVEGLTWLPLVSSAGTPLLLLGDVDGHRVAYSTFDLTHSNLPVQVAFPILGSNLLRWLGGGEVGATASEPAGTPVALTTPAGSEAQVTLPSGETRLVAADARTFVGTDQPGVYRVDYLDRDGELTGNGEPTSGAVAVRRFVATESAGPSRSISVVEQTAGQTEDAFLIREWAPWVIGAALVLMGIEWWVAHQRPGWRRDRKVPA